MFATIIMAAQQQGQGSMTPMLVMMAAIFVIMWFFMIRPQQKERKKIQEFQNSLQKGTKVVVGGGIYGTVSNIDLAAGVVEVEIAKNVIIRVAKSNVFADVNALQKA